MSRIYGPEAGRNVRLAKKAIKRRMPSVINAIIEDMFQQQAIVAERYSNRGPYTRTFEDKISYQPTLPITNLTIPDKILCLVSVLNPNDSDEVYYSQDLAFLRSMRFLSSFSTGDTQVVIHDIRTLEEDTFIDGFYEIEFSPEDGVFFTFSCRYLFALNTEEVNLTYLRLTYSLDYANNIRATMGLDLYGGNLNTKPFTLIGEEKPARVKYEPINLFPEEEVSPPADNVSWEAFLEKRGMSLENLPRDIFSTGDIKRKKLLEMGKKENVTVADLENPDDALKRKIMAILGKLPEEK